jgi:hypothetical protein
MGVARACLRRAVSGLIVRIPGLRGVCFIPFIFYYWNKLDVCGIEFTAEKTIYLQRMLGIQAIYTGERIERNTKMIQQFGCVDNLVKCGFSIFVDTKGIVKFPRTIDAQSHQPMIFFQELTPFLIEERTIGLEVVVDDLSRSGVFILKLHDLVEEIEPQESWLSPLPGKHHLISLHPFDVLLDEPFQDLVGHPAYARPIQQRPLA